MLMAFSPTSCTRFSELSICASSPTSDDLDRRNTLTLTKACGTGSTANATSLSPRSAHAHVPFVPRRDVIVDMNGLSRSADTSKTDFSSTDAVVSTGRGECADCEREGLLGSGSASRSRSGSEDKDSETSEVVSRV